MASSKIEQKQEEGGSDNHYPGLSEYNNTMEATNTDSHYSTLEDLFDSDMLPWNAVSDILPTSVISKLRII